MTDTDASRSVVVMTAALALALLLAHVIGKIVDEYPAAPALDPQS